MRQKVQRTFSEDVGNMIQCEHFIYALFNNRGYRLIKSAGVDGLVDDDNLYFLCHIGDNTPEPVTIQLRLPNEDLLAVSHVAPTEDEYGRRGVWNHTILIKLNDYLQLTQPSTMLQPYFINQTKEPPYELNPLTIKKEN